MHKNPSSPERVRPEIFLIGLPHICPFHDHCWRLARRACLLHSTPPDHHATPALPACPVAAAAEIIRAHITYPDIIHTSILVFVRGCFPCRPFAFTDDLVHDLPGLGILLVSCMRPGTCISAAPLLVSLLHAPKVTSPSGFALARTSCSSRISSDSCMLNPLFLKKEILPTRKRQKRCSWDGMNVRQ